jgi:IS30 family transposase
MIDAGRQATGDAVAQRGEKHGMSKLTEDQVRAIRDLVPTLSVREIARQYGVSPSTVSSIHLRKSWSHLS